MTSGMDSISRPSSSATIASEIGGPTKPGKGSASVGDRGRAGEGSRGGERILLARFHSLGDVILATGVAQRLVADGNNLDVVTSERLLPIFEGLPIAHLRTPAELPGAGRFDLVIDLQANTTSRRALRGLGPARACRTRPFARRWMVFWGRRRPLPVLPHVVERYAEAAGCPEADPAGLAPRVKVTDRDLDEARAFPRSMETTAGGDCIGLAVGGSRRMKRWPEDRYRRLAESLASHGVASLRFLEPIDGGHGEETGAVRAPLRPLKAILARCRALVTNDSGVMHLAVGLGIPVIAVFGSTVPEFGFAPLGPLDRVIDRDLACRPCAVHGARFCWLGHGRCLRAIGVDEVLQEALTLVRRGRGG